MQLFPERARSGRKLLSAALFLSLLVHAAGGGAWQLGSRRIAPAVAKLLPHPEPTPEFVATSDAIRIEKRTIPRAQRRTPPHRPRPRLVAQAPALLRLAGPLPTLAPPAAGPPTAVPTSRPRRRGTMHHPLPGPAAPPPRTVAADPAPTSVKTTTATTSGPPAARGAYSPQAVAELNAQFSKTIAQAQRALTDVPKQSHAPATTRKRYQYVMAGSRDDLLTFQADCVPTATWYRGPVVWHYENCRFVYGDGFSEELAIPWPMSYARDDDIFEHPGNLYRIPDPPDGWTLPHPFAFSRFVCIYYRSECEALIVRERANGDPNYAPP